MDSLTIITLALVHVGLVFYVVYLRSKKSAASAQAKASMAQAPVPAAPAVGQDRPRLQIEGSEKPATGDTRFLKLFGLANRPVLDMRFIPGPRSFTELPPFVSANLVRAYEAGDAVGTDVMEFIHHGRRLKDNQQLWFVLLSMGEQTAARLVAFVDIVRPAPIPVTYQK